ncbi:MAG: hypothetical protein JXO72_01420 [Vicinamibacteria bacterium]|nr:hypothetical protein [Vicinamibacteria bacterium]
MTAMGRIGLAILLCSVVTACGGNKPADTRESVNSAASAGEIGVPECDEYLDKYQACIEDKAPEAVRTSLVQALDQTRAGWKKAAATTQGKEGLAMACKQAQETARQAMTAYGCQW